ncbi:MAG TPA: hypothetical protein ENK85_07085 [Saprospiraceae bacterium]|nr:hypothetical protein [Saprospiraceae bacterium]
MRKIIATLFVLGFASMTFGQSLLEKANKQFELKAYQQAEVSYRKVLADDAQNVAATAHLADCYYYTNDMKQALAWYKKAINMPEVDPSAILRYGKAFMRSGDYSNAEKIFTAYAKIDPKVGQHYADYARLAAETATLPPFYNVKWEYLNTNMADFGATFLGKKVVYSSARTDIKRKLNTKEAKNWEGKAYNQLFITARDNKGFLQKPKLLTNDLAFNYNEGPVTYSENTDKQVVITKNHFINGHTLEANLASNMTLLGANYLVSGSWGHAKALPINKADYSSGFPSFAPDGKTLYFSSNRPGGKGGYDIYVSHYENDQWSSPVNLGAPVNTPGDEITPFNDGTNLFFSSNWLPGLGGFDLYRAEQGGLGTDADWVKVFHLGTGVNSSYDDYGFIFDNSNNIGYFTSNRRGVKSGDDIYQVTKVSDKIQIVVLNASDNNPLNGASIDFSACGEGVLKTNAKGKSVFQALAGLNCDATIRKPGYKSKKLKVSSSGEMKSKTFVVKLVQSDEEYIGKVVNNEDNEPMEQVLVTAYPSKGDAFKTFTNNMGEFTLPLKSNETYQVVYSKAGFSDVTKTVKTGDGKNRTILGIQAMINAYADVAFAEKGTKKTKGATGSLKKSATPEVASTAKKSEAVLVAKGADSEELKEIKKATAEAEKARVAAEKAAAEAKELTQKLAAEEKKLSKSKANLAQKYAVQVAAYEIDGKSINMSEYKDLFTEGNVYSRPSGKHIKIRVGVYDTKEDAVKHMRAIRKAGFKQAFVTKEYLEPTKADKSLIIKGQKEKAAPKEKVIKAKKLTPLKSKTTKKKSTPKIESKKAITKAPAPKAPAAKVSRKYYVQLAAYQNLKYFPRAKVAPLGKIVNTKNGKYTTMYVTGFESLEEAIDARNKAREIGFRRPYIVYKRNGKFVRMKL